jgi:hypothetical protein
MLHDCQKKLLVLLPVHQSDVNRVAKQCEYILGKFIPRADFQVVMLKGSGDVPKGLREVAIQGDAERVLNALESLGFTPDR